MPDLIKDEFSFENKKEASRVLKIVLKSIEELG